MHPPATAKGHVGTKIIATIGPATARLDKIEELIEAGVDVFRLNFSHGERADHQRMLDGVREAASKLRRPIAVLGDLCGPKIRLGEIDGGQATLATGDEIRLARDNAPGTARRLSINHPEILDDVQVGDRVLIDDGSIRLEVEARESNGIVCRCDIGGVVRDHKGVNLPDSDLRIQTITPKDRSDASWAAAQEMDYLALSFVRRADDIRQLRAMLAEFGAGCRVIAKIETPHAVRDIDTIIEVSDAIMVARGDLGVEMDVAQIPRIQKDIVDQCRRAAKPAIIATQMLQSMVEAPTPTRAEVSDVANAVVDCADALLLSAETAVGRYPAEAVRVLGRIAFEAEAFDQERGSSLAVRVGSTGISGAVARAVCGLAGEMNARAVAIWTRQGELARLVSKHRLDCPVLAFAPAESTCRRTALYYGVHGMQAEGPANVHHRIQWASTALRSAGHVNAGDLVVIGFSPQTVESDETGLIVIHQVPGNAAPITNG
jgi:pyruvate kinase